MPACEVGHASSFDVALPSFALALVSHHSVDGLFRETRGLTDHCRPRSSVLALGMMRSKCGRGVNWVVCYFGVYASAFACSSEASSRELSSTGLKKGVDAADASLDAGPGLMTRVDAAIEAGADANGGEPDWTPDASVERRGEGDASAPHETRHAVDGGAAAGADDAGAPIDQTEAGPSLWEGTPAPEECLGLSPGAREESVPCRLPNSCPRIYVDCVNENDGCEIPGAFDDAGTQRYFLFREGAAAAMECMFDALGSNQPTLVTVQGTLNGDNVDQRDTVAILGDGTAVLERRLRNDDSSEVYGPSHYRIRSKEWLQQCRELPGGKDKWLCLTNWFEPECLPGVPACPG